MFKNAKYVEWRNTVPPAFSNQQPFSLKIPVDRNWDTAKRRILFVLEHVDTEDLRSQYKRLMTGPSNSWVESAIDLGLDYAKHTDPQRAAYAAINFNFFKTYDLMGADQIAANEMAAARVQAYARKMKATDVVVFGDIAAAACMAHAVKDERTLLLRRGRPIEIDGVWWTNTISLSLAYQGKADTSEDGEEEEAESKIDHANLLGFVSRCIGNAMHRGIVYQFDAKPKIKFINDIASFKRLYKRMMECDRAAVDTETTSLGRVVNRVLTIQIAFDDKVSYVVPLDHKDAAWSPKEKRMVEKGFRNFFTRKFDPLSKRYDQYLLGQNLKFDMTILRQRFHIHMITWRVWDMMAGEYCLDENMKALIKCRTPASGKISPYSLEWMCAWYGCDFYAVNKFSKDDRATIETRSLDEPGVLEYCGMDVQVCWGIHDLQQERASRVIIKAKSYRQRFAKFVVTQMNNLVQIESVMEHRGDQLDMPYLMKLKDANGPLSKAKKEVESEFKKFASVIAVNKKLVKQEGLPQNTLFGGTPWIFSPSKPKHKLELFINKLKLQAVAYGKLGDPKIDKEFQEVHKAVPEVAAFTQLSQLDKLKSTYVNGFYSKLKTDPDMRTDFRIRPGFGFTGTVTGRSNSYDPNLQNIPQRGKFAKFIKRMFVAPRGCLTLKMDYSSHEVRMWGIIAGDAILCSLFVNGRWLRQQYRKTGNPAFKALMDTKGDIHKVNCEFFFKVEAKDVTKEQRNSVKSIVFGAIYGRGARAIAKQAGAAVESIKEILKQFFKRFTKASKWLEMAKKHAVDHGYMYSPIWRVRNMYTHLYGIDNLVAATERRGCNAPVQGFAADIGHTAAYLYQIHIEDVVRKFELDDRPVLPAGVNTFVHDAIKTDAPYEYLLVCLQVLQWCATIGAMQYYKNHWGIEFPVEIEVEFELAAHDETHWKWDWHEGNEGNDDGGGLRYVIRKSLEDQKEVYPDLDIDATEKKIWAVRKNKKLMAFLDENYPILQDWPEATHINVKDRSFINGLGKLIKEWKPEPAKEKA
jgi:DNA polymerase I-like protein with 3'-5' exonuclease and polymerase domains